MTTHPPRSGESGGRAWRLAFLRKLAMRLGRRRRLASSSPPEHLHLKADHARWKAALSGLCAWWDSLLEAQPVKGGKDLESVLHILVRDHHDKQNEEPFRPEGPRTALVSSVEFVYFIFIACLCLSFLVVRDHGSLLRGKIMSCL